MVGPANGTVVTNGYPTLSWSAANGATSYTVSLVGPKGTNYYSVTGTSLSLPLAQNGAYSWTVTPDNGAGNGPVSATGNFNVNYGVWKFGVISDTQWTGSPDDGKSPGTTPAGIIQQCDQAFIAQGVKFVIAVGDTVDTGSQTDMDIRALYAQDLYNAGIGFFPFRGNHESGWTGSAAEEARIYPQIVNGGTNNLTPSDVPPSGWDMTPTLTRRRRRARRSSSAQTSPIRPTSTERTSTAITAGCRIRSTTTTSVSS